MNWLDITLIVIMALGLLWGLKTGLISAIFTAVGILVGWVVAGQLADDIGGYFESSLNSDTLVTVVSYAVIIIASVIIIGFIGKIIKPIVGIATLGASSMVDKLGGLAMGLVIGLAIAGVFITGMARFAYNFTVEIPDIEIAGAAGSALGSQASAVTGALTDSLSGFSLPIVDDKKEAVEDALTESTIVPIFMNIRGALPGNALGFIPADFAAALDILQEAIDAQ
ncbi:MAG: CvpA family protein [Chloroflexi bacterium]|nr:CvpA family protein [Chloroflexota bacterium]